MQSQLGFLSPISSIRKQLLRGLLLLLVGTLVAGGHLGLWGQGGVPAAGDRDLASTLERLNRFEHITRILYITAHPDDENGPLLAYLSRGLGAQVALLTITRGEGGQNLMTQDQGRTLGLVRTDELLAAGREYGAEEQFFTRASDFGYTTNAQETLSRWGDPPLADMVRVIRTYRPDVVISRWTGTILDGHGHHQATGMLARHAVAAAADPNEYPDQLGRDLNPWRVPRFFMEVTEPAANTLALPVESFSPMRGKSYWQIGRAGYAHHRTQYTPAALEKATRAATPRAVHVRFAEENEPQPQITDFAERLDGLPLRYAFLEQKPEVPAGAAPAPSAAERLQAVRQAIERIRALIVEGKAEEALRALAEIRAHFETLAKDPVLGRLEPDDAARLRGIYERKLNELAGIAAELAGLEVEAYAETPAVAGQEFLVRVMLRANPEARVAVPKTGEAGGAFSLRLPRDWQARVLSGAQPTRAKKETPAPAEGLAAAVFSVTVPADAVRPSLLAAPTGPGRASDAVYEVADPWQAIWPRPRGMEAIVRFNAGGATWEAPPGPVSAARGELAGSAQESLQPVPPFLLRLPDRLVIRHGSGETRESRRIVVPVSVRSFCDPAAAGCRNPRMGGEAPEGWIVSTGPKISFPRAGDEALGQLIVIPPRGLAPGSYPVRCFVESEGKRYDIASSPYGYAGLAEQSYYHTAEVTVRVMNLGVPEGLRIGYIAGPNDPVPAALERVGVTVDRLDENALAFEDTAAELRYDALVIGIRALELRPDILARSGRWREYLEEGGVLVVEYQTADVWNEARRSGLSPLPATIDPQLPIRISDPKAPARLLLPNHPLLSQPNRLTAEDFDGWVSERGLSFLSRFDAPYEAPLAFADSAGTEAKGSLVYARVGKGIFIYTGISFFRQLPAGVPGAYRLFINLISQGRYPRY